MHGLSPRQKDILTFIESFVHAHGHSPSYREISKQLKFKSLGSVHKHIQILTKKGVLRSLPKCGRSLSITASAPQPHTSGMSILPLMGYVRAGYSIDMLPVPQQITIPSSMVNSDQTTYLLRARGDSLHEELIADGDLILVETREPYCDGETILCVVNDFDTMIKKMFEEEGYLRLEGQSAQHHPIFIQKSDVKILGVVTGLLRLYT